MLTTDCTGTYDYERDEATHEVDAFLRYASEYTGAENRARVLGIYAHWAAILTPEGLADFVAQWNSLAPLEYRIQ
jgi:hypothetical protein